MNTSLRDAIVEMYASYEKSESTFTINQDWISPIDAMLTSQYNALKYDATTAFLYKSESLAESASELRKDKDIYIRNVSNHYWINKDNISQFNRQKENSLDLMKKINQNLSGN